MKLFYNHGLKMTGLNIQYDKISKAINKNIYKCNYIQIGFFFFLFFTNWFFNSAERKPQWLSPESENEGQR